MPFASTAIRLLGPRLIFGLAVGAWCTNYILCYFQWL